MKINREEEIQEREKKTTYYNINQNRYRKIAREQKKLEVEIKGNCKVLAGRCLPKGIDDVEIRNERKWKM